MILSAVLSAAGSLVRTFIMPEFAMQLLATVVSFLVTSALFAAMFKWLPDAETVVPGALYLWRCSLTRGRVDLGVLHLTDRSLWG
jgi:uncharacterized BrkB/YihY/UPF0761 family membrane protein